MTGSESGQPSSASTEVRIHAAQRSCSRYTFGGKGHMRVSQSFLDEFCLEAHRRGFQIGAVAMGDAGNEAALKAI